MLTLYQMKSKINNMQPVDLNEKLKPYENKWVAFSPNHKKLLGVGNTLVEAKKNARLRAKKFVLIKLPPFNASYVPASL